MGDESESKGIEKHAKGWLKLMLAGQLEQAGKALDDRSDFVAAGMRGRIHSLLLDHTKANGHFEESLSKAAAEAKEPKAVAQMISIQGFRWQDDLVRLGATEAIPGCVATVRDAMQHPALSIRFALAGMNALLARTLIGLGRNREALLVYDSLLHGPDSRATATHALGFCYQGIGAAKTGLGESAIHDLETAEFYCQTASHELFKAHLSSLLAASWDFLDEQSRAQDWLLFLRRLGCSKATREAMERRGAILVARSMASRQLVAL